MSGNVVKGKAIGLKGPTGDPVTQQSWETQSGEYTMPGNAVKGGAIGMKGPTDNPAVSESERQCVTRGKKKH